MGHILTDFRLIIERNIVDMKVLEFKKNIDFEDSYDVIIAGGGPAGCAASIAAARSGAKTLLIEAASFLGGMSTGGLVPTWCPFSDGEKIIYRGIAEEIFNKSKEAVSHVKRDALDWIAIEPEKLKIIYDDLLSDAGVQVLFNTTLADVVHNGNGTVEAVITSNKDGLKAYGAKCFIDCTGDGDLAVRAGADYVYGDGNGNVQNGTLCFLMSNVDDYGYRTGEWLNGANKNSPVYKMMDDEELDLIDSRHMCSTIVGPGVVGFNSMHVDFNSTDAKSVSQALMVGRKKAQQVQKGLAKYHPKAFAGAFVSTTAPIIGTRESRIIEGEYKLTINDYIERKTFDDEICRNSYFLDIHTSNGESERLRKYRYTKGESHGIPYRCLVVKKCNNVLVAGRSISCEHTVQGSVRVMPVCLAVGEAAGYAAYIAARDGKACRDIDVQELRKMLINNGAYIK